MDQENLATSAKMEPECPACPVPPIPKDSFEIPKDQDCKEYEKIDPDEKKGIDFKRESAEKAADLAYEKSIADAEDVKALAETAFKAADRKHTSAVNNLDEQLKLDKKKLYLDYNKCLKGYMPKNCPVDLAEIPCDKKASCLTQFKLEIAKKDTAYIQAIQKINQEKSAATNDLKKAQEDYCAKLCNAKAIKDQAYLEAELAWSNDINKALDQICRL
jgi:hypothetical protein